MYSIHKSVWKAHIVPGSDRHRGWHGFTGLLHGVSSVMMQFDFFTFQIFFNQLSQILHKNFLCMVTLVCALKVCRICDLKDNFLIGLLNINSTCYR